MQKQSDEWIEWKGGSCPVPGDTLLDIKYRSGLIQKKIRARFIQLRDGRQSRSWSHNNVAGDIIAYRLHTEEPTGRKDDSKKWRFSLLPWDSVLEVIKVLEFGAAKYAPDNWQKVDNANERYFNAAMRHLTAWWGGEKKDSETNLSHLAHATCCLLFLMWFDKDKK